MSSRPTLLSLQWLIVALLAMVAIGPSAAQTSSEDLLGLDPAQVEELRRRAADGRTAPTEPLSSDTRILQPTEDRTFARPKELSKVEELYSQRSGRSLVQFGYETFGNPSSVRVRQSGAVQDDYILGPGDEIVIELRGQKNQTYRPRVDRDGRVSIPDLAPVPASGRRFGEFRADVEERARQSFIATQAFVSVGAIRQISVTVAGEVNRPGTVTLNALNTAADAILLSGGIKKSGTLRNIRIVRGQQTLRVDLYSILVGNNGPLGAGLADGDQIVVGPIGATVAAVGQVNRPAIFELAPGQSAIAAARLVELAGGTIGGGKFRFGALQYTEGGAERMTGMSESSGVLRRGDILFVESVIDVALGRVALEGQVRLPSTFDLGRHPTLADLIGGPAVFSEQPYMLFGAISRRDPKTFFRTLIPFSPLQVLRGEFNLRLEEDDVVRIFSIEEIREIATELEEEERNKDPQGRNRQAQRRENDTRQETGQRRTQREEELGREDTLNPTVQPTLRRDGTQEPRGEEALAGAAGSAASRGEGAEERNSFGRYEEDFADRPQEEVLYDRFGRPIIVPADVIDDPNNPYTEQPKRTSRRLVFDMANPAIRTLMANYRVSVFGSVQVPGSYLIAPGTTLDSLVSAAGGLEVSADLSSIEVTSTEVDSEKGLAKTSRINFSANLDQLGRIALKPRDVVRFREIYSDRDGGQVELAGQVRFPGTFDILRGEKLSSVIARAGGLTEIAYPIGAIFTRLSSARAEEAGYRRAAEELERQFTVVVAEKEIPQQAVVFIRDTIDKLEEAEGLGRVSVEADPIKLAASPQLDTILEPGDFLFVPRRPNSISVTGEVLSAGSFYFKSGFSGRQYIRLAGGFGPSADRGRAFVLMPDGTARPLSGSAFRFGGVEIVPGATIIVPRDLRPFRFRQFAIDVAQITSQLAVSAASIAVISNNN